MKIKFKGKKYKIVEYGKLWNFGTLVVALLIGTGMWCWATLVIAITG